MDSEILSLDEIEALALAALLGAGTAEHNARPLAAATAATEADGIASHGLAYIPIYAEHVRCGKVDGLAQPRLEQVRPALLRCDAATGFAHAAIELGFQSLVPMAREQGIAALAVYRSYNCGVLGYHTARLAEAGLLGIGFTNAPASIAPSQGHRPVFGTNPFSIAAPDGRNGIAVLIDQSASAIAKSEVMKHAREGRPIPEGWALDASGQPTTDATAGLQGSMVPSGGYKGAGVALMVELLAAAMTGANPGIEASPFSGTAGGPPGTGQFFIAIDPGASSGPGAGEETSGYGNGFESIVARVLAAIRDQPGARVPGDGRARKRRAARANGVAVSTATLAKVRAWVSPPSNRP